MPVRLATRLLMSALVLVACGGDDAAPTTTPTPGGTGASGGTTAPNTSAPAGPLAVGVTYADAPGYVEFVPGDAPLVLIAPHGGTLSPTGVPDRTCSGCVTSNDLNTQELARAIADAFLRRTGRRPHLVINRLHRRKFDANRDLAEATGGTPSLEPSWRWLHAAVDSAREHIVRRNGRGLVIDLHGHGHVVPRLELGYLLGDVDLRLSDAQLASSNAMTRTSIARLSVDTRSASDRGVALLRGPRSLGTLLVAAGYRAVPSASDPAPMSGEEYFEGGYNTQRHGSLSSGPLDAVQIECHLAGVRDTDENRARFADALVAVLVPWLATHYGWTP
jgi:hypothetical protein